MHTEIQAEMNKMNSFLFDTFTRQEVDIAINRSILRFLNQKYSSKSNLLKRGFEMSQKRIDDLRALVVSNYIGKATLPPSLDPDIDEKVNFEFPGNYYHAVASRFRVAHNQCGSISPQTDSGIYNYYLLDMGSFPSNTNIGTIEINETSESITVDLPAAGNNYSFPEDTSLIASILMQKLTKAFANYSDVEFYWESYKELYAKNSIIFLIKSDPSTYNFEYQYELLDETPQGPFTLSVNDFTFSYYTNAVTLTTSGKLTQEDDIYAMQADPFNKTSAEFPLYFSSEDHFNIYYQKTGTFNFVVTDVILSYIRKPNVVSYYLEQDCDLPDATHQEIVSMSANYLLEVTQAGERFKTQTEMVLTNE